MVEGKVFNVDVRASTARGIWKSTEKGRLNVARRLDCAMRRGSWRGETGRQRVNKHRSQGRKAKEGDKGRRQKREHG